MQMKKINFTKSEASNKYDKILTQLLLSRVPSTGVLAKYTNNCLLDRYASCGNPALKQHHNKSIIAINI